MMEALWNDVKYGIRMLAKNRGVTLVALLTLALGIGANTAIFSVVYAVLLRPLPFAEPDRLVRVTADFQARQQSDIGMSVPELFDYRDRSGLFEQISGLMLINVNLTEANQPERAEALLVDANYFAMLGAKPQLGRVFGPADYQPGIAEIAVISDGLWRRRYGADPGIIGKKCRLDNDLFTIIGVMPPGFRHPGRWWQSEIELWAPSGWVASPFRQPVRFAFFLEGGLARLRPGVRVADAQAGLNQMAEELRSQHPDIYSANLGWAPRVIPLQEDLVGHVRPALLVLLGAVGFVLLIACANVANLLLARAAARHREMAIRQALGAGRRRLMRQLVTESGMLALAGGALGLLLATWGVDALVALSPANAPRLGEVGLSAPVFGFTLLLSLVCGIGFGLVPALASSRVNLQDNLKETARTTADSSHSRARSLLVVSEFALALVLVIGAALMIRSFGRLLSVDLGFDPQNVFTARVWLPQPNIPESGPYFIHASRVNLYRRILERLAAMPGVERAAIVTRLPLGGWSASNSFMKEGDGDQVYFAQANEATPGYFEAMRIPLLRGRTFTEQDQETGEPVAIISESLARKYFPDQDPLGLRLRPGGRQSTAPWLRVVGMVRDVRALRLDAPPGPQLYRPVYQISNLAFSIVLRTQGGTAGLAETLRREVQAVDPDLPLFSVAAMDEVLGRSAADRRFAMVLLGLFGGLALVLAAVGISGVMAYVVSQRTHEIGIRVALGARGADIVRLVLSQGLGLAVAGVAVGLGGAWLLTRYLDNLLFEVGARDPLTFVGVPALLTLVALAACLVPARRAMRVDPMVALRYE